MQMIRTIPALLLLFSLTHSPLSIAVSEQQFEAVNRLGALNGIALNCRMIEQTRKMKHALVDTVPKLRVIGEAFDQSTNRSFLSMIKANEPCPAEPLLNRQVDHGIEELRQQFSTSLPLLQTDQ